MHQIRCSALATSSNKGLTHDGSRNHIEVLPRLLQRPAGLPRFCRIAPSRSNKIYIRRAPCCSAPRTPEEAARWSNHTPPARKHQPSSLAELWGQLSYQYYNWRQDSTSDLLLFGTFFVALVRRGAVGYRG